MSAVIPPAFVDYAESRGCEVHVMPYYGFEDPTTGEWHDGGEDIVIRKEEIVRDRSYMQAMTVDEKIFQYPERWEMLVDLLEVGLAATVRRGEAHLN